MSTSPARTPTPVDAPTPTRRKPTAWIHAALLVLAPVEVATAILILIGVTVAPWIPITVGVLLAAAVTAEVVLAFRSYRRARRTGYSRRNAVRATARASLPAPVSRFARFEILLWESLGRWVTRRPRVPAGGRAFSYHRHESPVLLAFAGLGVVEIAVVHWLLPWPIGQVIAAVLGVMGVIWILGFLASLSTRPHYVTAATLTVRVDAHHDIRIERSTITTVMTGLAHSSTDGVHVEPAPGDDGAAVSVIRHGQTNVSLSLAPSTAVQVAGHGVIGVKTLAFWVDEPEQLRRCLRE